MEKIKIQIVEDEIIIASSLKRVLENSGYSVSSSVASGEDAIKKAEEDNPDLVLTDIILQGKMNGIEAAKIIRLRFGIPVIFLTSCTDEITQKLAMKTKPFGYLIKPFENKELNSTIEMALYKHKAEKDRNKLIKDTGFPC